MPHDHRKGHPRLHRKALVEEARKDDGRSRLAKCIEDPNQDAHYSARVFSQVGRAHVARARLAEIDSLEPSRHHV